MDGTPLEPSPEAMRVLTEHAVRFVLDHVADLEDAPALDASVPPAHTSARAPEQGGDITDLLRVIADAARPGLETAGPGYLAYVPGGGLFASALGDFIAAALNRFVGMRFASPGLAAIEAEVVRWMCGWFELPSTAGGILTSGGSLANLSALLCAREVLRRHDLPNACVYVTEHTHHSVAKAARIAGFDHLKVVASDEGLRMRVDALHDQIEADVRSGMRPACIVASAGTTNTGAIDPLRELRPVADRYEMWLHVDGAYGACFQLTGRGRAALDGIGHADSITLDPHKGLFVPYGTGALLVRDLRWLASAHRSVDASYLQDLHATGGSGEWDASDLSPELSRPFRGLRVWLPIRLHGLAAFRQALDEKLDLARILDAGLRDVPGLHLPWRPALSVVAFRRDTDDQTRRLLDALNASGRVALSSTRIDGRMYLRACILSHRTHRDRVDECIRLVSEAVG